MPSAVLWPRLRYSWCFCQRSSTCLLRLSIELCTSVLFLRELLPGSCLGVLRFEGVFRWPYRNSRSKTNCNSRGSSGSCSEQRGACAHWPAYGAGLPEAAVTQDPLDDIPLAALDQTDDLHRAAALGTLQPSYSARQIIEPSSVKRTTRSRLNGQRKMY